MRIIIAILIFSFIIIFHELGHMLLAKKNGIKVIEFSVGLGPTLIGKKFGETVYSIKLLPFGGACQMLGEDFDQETKEEGSFYSKSVWARMAVILAGPFFNIILAFILALFVTGFAGIDKPVVTDVSEGSPAYTAGLRAGDVITRIDKDGISIGRDIDSHFFYDGLNGKDVTVYYKRDGIKKTAVLTPEKTTKYLLGISYTANNEPAVLSSVSKDSAAYKAGLLKGDTITNINGKDIEKGADLAEYFSANPLSEEGVTVMYSRFDKKINSTVEKVTVVYPTLGPETYVTGFSYNLARTKTDFLGIIKYSCVEVRYWVETTVKNLGMLIRGKVSADDMGGAVAIVDLIGDSYEETRKVGTALDVALQLMYICIFLSANLGIMNLLPIPALDGGKFLLLIVEAIMRKPLNRKVEGIINIAGFIFLMGLMIFVFFNDIRKLIMGI